MFKLHLAMNTIFNTRIRRIGHSELSSKPMGKKENIVKDTIVKIRFIRSDRRLTPGVHWAVPI